MPFAVQDDFGMQIEAEHRVSSTCERPAVNTTLIFHCRLLSKLSEEQALF